MHMCASHAMPPSMHMCQPCDVAIHAHVPIKHLEGVTYLLLLLRVGACAPLHEDEELVEVDGPAAVGVDLLDDLLQLRLRWVLT